MTGKVGLTIALLMLAMGLTLATGFSGSAAIAAEPYCFSDLDRHWARSQVTRLGALDLVKGYPDGTYRPERLVTRLETVALVIRTGGFGVETGRVPTAAAGANASRNGSRTAASNGAAAQKPRVPWGQAYLDLAADKGFIELDRPGEFIYDAPASRLETAKLLARALYLVPPLSASGGRGNVGTELENTNDLEHEGLFIDEEGLSAADRDIVRAVAAAGVMAGYPDGSFDPQKSLTRAELAVILSRLVDRGWVKTADGRRISGWISGIADQRGRQELELTTLAGVQKLRLAAGALCFSGEEVLPLERALNCRCEIILDSRRQAAWVNLLEKKAAPARTDRVRGSVRSVALGEDNLLVLNDLYCQDRTLPLAWDAVVEGKNAGKGFQSLKTGVFVDLELSGGLVRKATVLEVKTVSGTVDRFDERRLYLKEGLTKNRPGWFNYWDRARITDREGRCQDRVSVGDRVQITYIDPYPDEIDDEIIVEIKMAK